MTIVVFRARQSAEYRPADQSKLRDLAASELAARIDWPERD
jgi:hypothetical protein